MGLLDVKRFLLVGFLLTIFLSNVHCQNNEDYEYERSSLHMMLIKHLNHKFDSSVEDVFANLPFPDRFNNHDLGVRTIAFAEISKDEQSNIESFIRQVNLGQKMVSKWFGRNKETGSFNMNLVRERGFYNASQNKINEARANIRGLALLEDAGENLISKTFLLVNDINYNTLGTKSIMGFQNPLAMTKVGGFEVEITTYLFRLCWNDEVANTFYYKYYTEDGLQDAQKVKDYKQEKELFKMEFVGKTYSKKSEKKFTIQKDPAKLLHKVCTRTLDENINQLQHQYEEFRIKAPLTEVEPISAYVGMKEGIDESSRFEVLERVMDEEGHVHYKRAGVIKPVKGKIWDNRFMADEEDTDEAKLGFTTFEKVSGSDFYPGMLIREIGKK